MGRTRQPITERFWPHVDKRTEEECWIWRGNRYPCGYGMMKLWIGKYNGYFTSGAHRVSWAIHFGPIPEGFHVLHRCDTPLCVNPAHLFLGTHQQNLADMIAKGRHLPGIERTRTKNIGRKHTVEARQKMSAAKINAVKEGKHNRARAVEIDGVIYSTLQAAAEAHGKTHRGIAYWIRTGRARSLQI